MRVRRDDVALSARGGLRRRWIAVPFLGVVLVESILAYATLAGSTIVYDAAGHVAIRSIDVTAYVLDLLLMFYSLGFTIAHRRKLGGRVVVFLGGVYVVGITGNTAEVVRLKGKTIGFCTGCYACQKTGKCVIKDDANALVEKICDADAVVFGTPVYYFSISGQLKTLLDRCVFKWPEPKGKPYYLVATMAEDMDWNLVEAPIQGFVDCFEGAELKGFLKVGGVYEEGVVKSTKFMDEAFALGKSI